MPRIGEFIMSLIKNYDYIEQLGIKRILHSTNLGNNLYILNNDQKFKEFSSEYKDLTDTINIEFRDNLEKQTEYYGDNLISFPEVVISNNQELFGVVSDYETGIPLSNINPLTEIDHLLFIIEYLEKGIKSITEKGWNLEDLHEENILINLASLDKPVRIIDTDFYCLQAERNKLELYYTNIKRVFFSIIYSVIPRLTLSNIWRDQEIQKYYHLASSGSVTPSDFMKFLLLKLKLEQQSTKNVQTLRKSL